MTFGRGGGRGGRARGQGMGRGRGAGRGRRRGAIRRAGHWTDRNPLFALAPGGVPFAAPPAAAGVPRNKAKAIQTTHALEEAPRTMPSMPENRNQETTSSGKRSIQAIAVINEEMCIGCGICADICREHAVVFMDANPKIKPDRCSGCGDCIDQCPNGAISLVELKQAAGT
jgi:ferredoxin